MALPARLLILIDLPLQSELLFSRDSRHYLFRRAAIVSQATASALVIGRSMILPTALGKGLWGERYEYAQ